MTILRHDALVLNLAAAISKQAEELQLDLPQMGELISILYARTELQLPPGLKPLWREALDKTIAGIRGFTDAGGKP